tara:strand:+ start:2317 stop:3420 length:1104 start_codon:yes stop_codon:yes gene_type:complete
MKSSCKVENLKNKIILLEKITGKNLSLPVLNSVIIEASKNNLTVKATNLEVGVEITTPAKIEKEGVVAVSGSTMSHFLSTLQQDETVSLEVIGSNLSISSKNNSTLLKVNPIDDFPIIPKIKDEKNNKTTTQTQILVSGIRSVLFAASTSDIKPEISSVYMYSDNNALVFVATDSFRLAEKKNKNQKINIDPVLVPYKNAQEIIRFFEAENTDVDILIDKNQLSLQTKDTYFTTRLTDGVYPNYKQIIPTTFDTQVIVLKNDLITSLKTANIFVDEFNRLTFNIIVDDNTLEIESKNANIGENTTKVDAKLEGQDVTTSFNHKYINEVLQIIPTDSVSLQFSKKNKPLMVRGVGDDTFIYFIMPVNR